MRDMFGKLLREWRGKAAKTMGDVARCLNVTVAYISDVERGVRTPFTTENIMKVARFLDIPPAGTEQLLHAAAEWRGSYELNVGTPQQNQVAAALMRGWASLSEGQLKDIQRIVAHRHKTGEYAAVNEEEKS